MDQGNRPCDMMRLWEDVYGTQNVDTILSSIVNTIGSEDRIFALTSPDSKT